MKLIATSLLFFLALNHTNAQYSETIRTNRPGQAFDPYSVGSRVVQFQPAMDLFFIESSKSKESIISSNNEIRYGVNEKLEINSVINIQSNNISTNNTKQSFGGIENFQLGMKYNLLNSGKGIFSGVGLLTRFRLPISSEVYSSNELAPTFSLITSGSLIDKLSMSTVWGVAFNLNDNISYNYVLNTSYSLTDHLSSFIENYGTIQKNVIMSNKNFNTYFDAGFSYLVNRNLQLDILGGAASNFGIKQYFVSIGLAWRTGLKQI